MIRVGIGYDSHRIVEGRKMILGMVEIPFDKGFAGHSDGDLLSHAIIDALLGAAGLPDIGRHFPDSDPAYQGVSSAPFFARVLEELREKGYAPTSIDSVVILQRPKLAPHIDAIRSALSQALELPVDCVNVKAKTAEGMGEVGRGEGAEAHAVAVIQTIGWEDDLPF